MLKTFKNLFKFYSFLSYMQQKTFTTYTDFEQTYCLVRKPDD